MTERKQRLRRFYAGLIPAAGQLVTIEGDEAHHIWNVTRVRVGEDVLLFNGNGDEAHALLVEGGRRKVVLKILSCDRISRESTRELTIACALPRASRMDYLVEKCCELGLTRLIPMVTQRSVVDPLVRQKNQQQRWKRATIEASKQCGRTTLMEVGTALAFSAAALAGETNAARMIASAEPDAISLQGFERKLAPEKPVFALIGPEGGFTPEEVTFARDTGYSVVSLGPRILRVETAAVALAARLLLGDAQCAQS